jgi:hypothetical protein
MPPLRSPHVVLTLIALVHTAVAACAGVGVKRYEYEEELYLSIDGSATLNVNSSVPALVALRGADLRLDPGDRLDRDRVRSLFSAPGVTPSVNLSRRDGRRFVHVSIDVDDVHRLEQIPMLAWSRYRLQRTSDVVEYRQSVGAAAGKAVSGVGWNGGEVVAFRMHVPSEILFHNTGGAPQRGNILAWEQRLADRLKGDPVEMHVRMEPESILYTTLLLFVGTIVAAALTFAVVVWWLTRRARGAHLAESHS